MSILCDTPPDLATFAHDCARCGSENVEFTDSTMHASVWRCLRCGATWQPASELDRAPKPPASEPELPKPTIRYAGARPIVKRVGTQGVRIFAEASPPESRGVPNVCVFILPSGQHGVGLEEASTPAMHEAIGRATDHAIAQLTGKEVSAEGDGCKEVHREIVRWLRREWAIGRIERKDGVWGYVASGEEKDPS